VGAGSNDSSNESICRAFLPRVLKRASSVHPSVGGIDGLFHVGQAGALASISNTVSKHFQTDV
jgi:hypothetical protein